MAAEHRPTHFQQVAQAELAITVLVKHRAQQATAQAALRLNLPLFLAKDVTERPWRGNLAATARHALRQIGHHDRRKDFHQHLRLVAAEAGDLAEAGLGTRQLAAEDVAKLAHAVGLAAGLLTAQHGAEDVANAAGTGVVAAERTEQ